MSSLCKGKVSKGVLKHTKYLLSLFRKWLHCNFVSFPEVEFIKLSGWKKSLVNDYEFQFSVRIRCTALQMKGLVDIQYKWLVPIYVVPEVNCYFQDRIIMFCLPVPTLIFLWEIYIFPGSVCLFCCREICGPSLGIYKSLTEIGTEAEQIPEKEYIIGIFLAVCIK